MTTISATTPRSDLEGRVARIGVFNYLTSDRIVFGRPAAEALRDEAARLGAQRVFLMASGTMTRTTDEVDRVRHALGPRLAGVWSHMPPHTPRDAVVAAANEARALGADLIATFGGSSLTDAGKVVQICLKHGISDVDGLEPFRMITYPDGTRHIPQYEGPTIRQIAIPTTLSAGEFNSQAGCTDTRIKRKQSYRHPLLTPRAIILDPAPTRHTPMWVWLSTGVRAVDHAVELYCSNLANPITDASALHALRLLSRALPRVKQDPGDMDARLDCLFGAAISLVGRQADIPLGASHAIGHILGGTCDVPHGITSCLMLPHVLRYNRPVNAAKQADVAAAMGQPGADAADVVAELVRTLGLPQRLFEVGVTPEQFPLIAKNSMQDPSLHGNPRRITSEQQVIELLQAAA